MQGTNPENQEKVLELIKYSSPTDVEYLSVVVEPKLTANKDKYNNKESVAVYDINRSTGFESSVVSADDTESDEGSIPESKIDLNESRRYTPVFTYITKFISDHELALSVNEEELYQERQREISQCWDDQLLTTDEISYWEEKERQIYAVKDN